MIFNIGDKVHLKLDSDKNIFVITNRRPGLGIPIYTIKPKSGYGYDEAWEFDLIGIEEPNEILKKVL